MHFRSNDYPARPIQWQSGDEDAAKAARSFASAATMTAQGIREQLGTFPALLEPNLVSVNHLQSHLAMFVREVDNVTENLEVARSMGRCYLNGYNLDDYRVTQEDLLWTLNQITIHVADVAGFRPDETSPLTRAEHIGAAMYFTELFISQLWAVEQDAESILEAIERASLV